MSSKKGVGSSKNGRDSESKRLGLKIGAGQYVSAGSILVRQESRSAYTAKKLKLIDPLFQGVIFNILEK